MIIVHVLTILSKIVYKYFIDTAIYLGYNPQESGFHEDTAACQNKSE